MTATWHKCSQCRLHLFTTYVDTNVIKSSAFAFAVYRNIHALHKDCLGKKLVKNGATVLPAATVAPAALVGVSVPHFDHDIQNPPVYQWTIVNETGDGACLLRSISRYLHGSPDHHHTLRNMLVQFVSANLDTVFPNTIMTFRHDIQNGIANNEEIVIEGQFPVAYNSVEQYLQLVSNPHAYATYIEIAAAKHMFDINIHIVAGQVGPPQVPQPNTYVLRSLFC